jgi:diguanylate cyclase (GGDEF)-like protein/PAS domain S-box-containing protein
MNFNRLRLQSLKTRVTLFTLFVFLLSIWSLVLYADRALRQDVQRLLGKQQHLTASLLAAEVNRELETALHALNRVATEITPEMMRDTVILQKTLESFPIFQERFNTGTYITDSKGTAIASVPLSANRLSLSYLDRDYIQDVLKSGRSVIGRPVIGRVVNVPVLGLGVPIFDQYKNVIGVLAGVINLTSANSLVELHQTYLGKEERFLIVDGKHRIIVTSSEQDRVMEQLPPAGVNRTMDRFINGFEGIEIFVNPRGDEVLTAVKHIPIAEWYAAISLPTRIAFEPIRKLERNLLLAAVFLSLFASGMAWWILARQLAPLQAMAAQLSAYTQGQHNELKLTYHRSDEIGQLVQSFNRLLEELENRQKLLRDSTELHRMAFRTSPDAVSMTKIPSGVYLDVNDGFTKLFGWSRDEVVGKTTSDLGLWLHQSDRNNFIQTLESTGHCENLEATFLARNGRHIPVLVSGNTMILNGEPCLFAVTHDISIRKAALEEVQELSFTDPMTGLPNRRFYTERFIETLAYSRAHQQLSALIYIDLDNFKSLNESFGHDKGDLLLRQVAKRIKDTVRDTDIVMRISGDKFLILLEKLAPSASVAKIETESLMTKLLSILSLPYQLSGLEHFSSCSMGATLFGDQQESSTEVLNKAELAMYQAKAAGRHTWRFFSPEMQVLVSARAMLEAHLREALRDNQFLLYYQPQVDEHGQVVGVESLIRWHSPQRGMVSPSDFIPLAEEMGLIVPLGLWALEEACRQLVRWSAIPQRAHLTIAVNVSANQFNQEDFVSQVLSILKRTGAQADRLKIELTESVLVNQVERVIEKMNLLKIVGVKFSLDDFGTGFSSLSYLKRMPLDQLKIDQAFTRDILTDTNDEAIARTVVVLGKTLGFSVIAEGVETQAQRNTLYAMGCVLYQGYLFSKPLPIEVLESYLLSKTQEDERDQS